MLEMGFREEVQKVFDAIKAQHSSAGDDDAGVQTVLFSATLPSWVQKVAKEYMHEPKTIDLVGAKDPHASADVTHICVKCPWQLKASTAADLVRVYGGADGRTIIFCDTKKECEELTCNPKIVDCVEGGIKALHGDVPQGQREKTMSAFREGRVRAIIATDVAARGLDVKNVDLVIMMQPPSKNFSGRADPDTYVHRSGRPRQGHVSDYVHTHKNKFCSN